MHRFLIQNSDISQNGVYFLPPDEARHASKVLRLKAGDVVEVSDGAGRIWHGEIAEISRDSASLRVTDEIAGRESQLNLTLYMGLPKAEKLELIVQKLTELGAGRIVSVVMKRSVPKPGEDSRRMDRLERIALEATKQCGRARVPEIALMSWREALEDMRMREMLLVPWEESRSFRLIDAHAMNPEAQDIGILVGPEGGIDPGEAREAEEIGGKLLTLGPRILRAETAAISASAIIMSLWGDV